MLGVGVVGTIIAIVIIVWLARRGLSKHRARMGEYGTHEQTGPKLRKVPQPPLSQAGATPDSDRAKTPRLVEPPSPDKELTPGDRVAGLGNFGKPTGSSVLSNSLTTRTQS
jgi:hypothetical protein